MANIKTSASGQKFIARNRAPRVQIEYDVELYGAERKVQLPFVMGVLADLAGDRNDALPDLGDRKFMEIDVDNFDERMKAINPTLALEVPNTLTGDGHLKVALSLQCMDDFAPAALARQVEPLRRLLQARTELANLLSYIDGKRGAEALLAKALANPALLEALSRDGAAPEDTSAHGHGMATEGDSDE